MIVGASENPHHPSQSELSLKSSSFFIDERFLMSKYALNTLNVDKSLRKVNNKLGGLSLEMFYNLYGILTRYGSNCCLGES